MQPALSAGAMESSALQNSCGRDNKGVQLDACKMLALALGSR